MATTEKQLKSINGSSKRKRFLPHNKPVKKKGSYPLRPGIKGFFITCDGGREHQASLEAINVIDSFFEELVQGPETNYQHTEIGNKLLNKKIKFSYSDNSEDDEDGDDDIEKSEENIQKRPEREDNPTSIGDVNHEISHDEKLGDHKEEEKSLEGQAREDKDKDNEANMKNHGDEKTDIVVPPNKKQHVEVDPVKAPNLAAAKNLEQKSIDKLIEAELAELGDKSKRRFSKIASGCNGVVIVQMRKRDGDPSPKDIVQYMMTSLASTRKHVSRFMLRVLPIELTCYASEEEITRAIKPLIAQYFPQETQNQHKFSVLYDARANTGIDRMKIINAVAKSVPSPHKVDLNNPDINIVVQVVKTVCMIGVVEKYKELAKYNLRQLASPKP